MTDRDFRDQVERIKTAVDGRLVADRLGLRGSGRRFFCPACQPNGGKTPDLSVLDRGFRCFKCGMKGDLIQLVELAQQVDFKTAVDWLARESGLNAPATTKRRPSMSGSKAAPIVRPARSSEAVSSRPIRSTVLTAFLDGCRPVEGPALAYMTGRGIDPAVVARIGLRFCGREYADLTAVLTDRFGPDALLTAGLLTKGRTDPVPTFRAFVAKQVGFLVFPYRMDGQPVYLKARPPIDKATAETKRIPRFLNTGGTVPCPFNADGIAEGDRVLVCEGETDTLTALSNGYAAVGIPGWAAFKAEWVRLFEGKAVFLVLDADQAGARGVRDIALKFDRAGFPLPRQVILPPGQDLNDFFQQDGRME